VKKLIAIAIIFASLAPRLALAGDGAAECGTPTFLPGDLPTADEAKALKGCDFDSLYYGLDMPADPVKARKCAFVQRDAEIADVNTTYVPSASNFLIVIYANAKGVPRNLDIALALACRLDIDNAQMSESWTERLRQMKRSRSPPDFKLCDGSWFTTAWSNYCARVETKREMKRLLSRRAELTAKLSPDAKAGFAKLEQAAEHFFVAVSGLGCGGTSAYACAEWAYAEVEEEFNELLEQSLAKKPSMTGVGFAEADAALNAAYAEAMAAHAEPGTDAYAKPTSDEDIRDAQRRWIRYRDAWIQFGRTVHPEMPADAWKVWLTQRQASRLEKKL